MRIAIPVLDGLIPNHIGHSATFLIADVRDGVVVGEEHVVNPGHGPGGPPPVFLQSQGVEQVVAWGMPPHAFDWLTSLGIRVQRGATGDPRKALADFLAGTLTLTDERLDAGGSCGHDHDPGVPHDHHEH